MSKGGLFDAVPQWEYQRMLRGVKADGEHYRRTGELVPSKRPDSPPDPVREAATRPYWNAREGDVVAETGNDAGARDALDGQAAMDEANNRVVDLERELDEERGKHARLDPLDRPANQRVAIELLKDAALVFARAKLTDADATAQLFEAAAQFEAVMRTGSKTGGTTARGEEGQ